MTLSQVSIQAVETMQIFINRNSLVSLQDQLSAQIGHLIASGELGPGERLPSIRALARRLRIHHNTVLAAYQVLQARALVVVQQGSGARVADFAAGREPWLESLSLRSSAVTFVAEARARGHSDEAILEACRAALAPAKLKRLVVVNPHPDLQTIYLHELGEWLNLPMDGLTPEEVEASAPDGRAEACFVTSTNHAPRLQEVVPSLVISRLASMEPLLNRARELSPESMIAIVSASDRFRFLLKEMLSAVCDESQLIEVPIEDREQVKAIGRLCRLVVTDAASEGALTPRARAPIYCCRLLDPALLEDLSRQLPPEAFRPVF